MFRRNKEKNQSRGHDCNVTRDDNRSKCWAEIDDRSKAKALRLEINQIEAEAVKS
jgi:hypothetical protein